MTRLTWVVFAASWTLASPAMAQDPAGPLGVGPTANDDAGPITTAPGPGSRAYFFGAGFGVGAVAAAVAVPVSVGLAGYLGTLASGLVGAAVPSVLTLLLVPPVLTTLAMWTFANLFEHGGFKVTPALWVALGTHVATVFIAGLMGAAANQPGDLVLLTVADALLMSSATLAAMNHTRVRSAPGVQLRWEF